MDINNLMEKDKNVNDASPCGDACALSSDNKETRDNLLEERIKKAKVGIKLFLISQGQSYYDLGKYLSEALEGLSDLDKNKIYAYTSDQIGISVGTLKNIVWLYKKLSRYLLWHTETNLFKMRLFQLAYYIWKKTSEFDVVFNMAYKEIVSNDKMKAWLIETSYKDLIEWAKVRFDTYFKAFKKGFGSVVRCEICNGDLRPEDKGKTWNYIAIHHNCFEMLLENNQDKVRFLKAIVRRVKRNKLIRDGLEEIQKLKQELLEKIQQYDAIRLAKSKRYKLILEKIDKIVET